MTERIIDMNNIVDKLQHNEELTEQEEKFATMAANQHHIPALLPYMKEFFVIAKNVKGKVYGTSAEAILKIIDGVKSISEIEEISFEDCSLA